MPPSSEPLRWTAQLRVAPSNRRLVGDKITLPQSALESLLAAAPVVSVQNNANRQLTSSFDPFNPYSFAAERRAREAFEDRQQQLPHPLTFRLVNPHNGRAVYAGIREFSAAEGTIGLSGGLQEALGLQNATPSASTTREGTPDGDVVMTNGTDTSKGELITIHAKQLQKGTFVKLRPLEAGYDPEDWKSLLERYLRDNYTTLTRGELLVVPGAHHERFRFLVDKFEPDEDGICIVDTDLEVDIEPLNEEQARETLKKTLAKKNRGQESPEGSSLGGPLRFGSEIQGRVLPGHYVDYELTDWDKTRDFEVTLQASDDDTRLNLLVAPFSAKQRSKPRDDEYVFGDLSVRPTKRLKLSHTSVDLEDAEALNVAVHAWSNKKEHSQDSARPISYRLQISTPAQTDDAGDENGALSPEDVMCKNCRQVVPKRTLPLHEAFCYRNNILCPKCSEVFLKKSDAWQNHWHCPHDGEHGNDAASHEKHDAIFHPQSPLQCPECDFQAYDVPILAHHRTTTCPGKEILCQFCHLVVPQQGPEDPSFTDPEVLMSGLTPHELADGARTTECHLCNKIVRLRDMKTHLRLHDRERFSRPKPRLCSNRICGRVIKSEDEQRVQKEQLGLCNECFGPLYVTSYDPEGKMLRRRIERRLLQQLTGGCGKPWCRNLDFCRTAYKNVHGEDRVVSAKDGLAMIKPIVNDIANGTTTSMVFCVDEASQARRKLADMITGEGEYELEWCVQALEEEKGDLDRAREWLKNRAPKVGELVS
ncbi:putative ubiquitin fusion degradation protein (Ufd1) [Cladophialophora carrionii]|uniref:Putative ubiquitin fusion degradation protein (Ufd1) n=1 Tax=Cladophialophora carrionii TaxID=86049 RepID=A0A1C1CSE6_9EURO|nr:putative ubiquitin fusion degradation protein (Ufd1) [Cladophialophora carrionii]